MKFPSSRNVSRRRVLKGLAAGGLVLAAQFPVVRDALGYATGADKMPNGTVSDPHIFVSIARDGIVTIVAARAEMGTGAARTTLPMIVADELEADWARVRIKQSPGDEKTYGNQDTDGSRSVRHFIQPMRLCGASARTMLETGSGQSLGRGGGRGRGEEPRSDPRGLGTPARLRRRGGGRRRIADAGGRPGTAQGAERLPLHRQGQRSGRRPDRHHHRAGDVRPGHPARRHEIRRRRAPAGRRRQGRVI